MGAMADAVQELIYEFVKQVDKLLQSKQDKLPTELIKRQGC